MPTGSVRLVCGLGVACANWQISGRLFRGFALYVPHHREGGTTLTRADQAALFQCLYCIAIGGSWAYYFIIFQRRKTGSPPSESVSSWNPCPVCQLRSCSTQ